MQLPWGSQKSQQYGNKGGEAIDLGLPHSRVEGNPREKSRTSHFFMSRSYDQFRCGIFYVVVPTTYTYSISLLGDPITNYVQ